jgi:hypothetical protein
MELYQRKCEFDFGDAQWYLPNIRSAKPSKGGIMGRNGIGALVAIAALAACLAGCSQEGNLVVENAGASEFGGTVENTHVMIDPGASYRATIYIGKSLAFIGPADVKVAIEGSSATKRTFRDEAEVKGDETITYRIIDDVGACNFANGYKLQVNEISYKLCDSTSFDVSLLGVHKALAPGSKYALQLDAGCWDILVNYGREELLDTVTAIPIEVGDIIDINWVPGYVYTP